jgi:hypothetical protein
VSPTPYINFMPPEVLTAGEDQMLAALVDHPPDAIVITSSSTLNGRFAMDQDYTWGSATFAWIQRNYEPIAEAKLPRPYPTLLGLVLMRPKTVVRVSLPQD